MIGEEDLRRVLAVGISELIPDARCRGCAVIVGIRRAFEVHVWLEEAMFSINTRGDRGRELVVFDLADPESIPSAARAIMEWDLE